VTTSVIGDFAENANGPSRLSVLDGVADKIVDDLDHALTVDQHGRQMIVFIAAARSESRYDVPNHSVPDDDSAIVRTSAEICGHVPSSTHVPLFK
jgi:hypothetical protein